MTMAFSTAVRKVVPYYIVAADGTGDYDTIQVAIDALPATGGQIFVKAGTYTVTSTITINKDNVVITGTGYGTHVTISTSDVHLFSASSVNRVVIENIRLSGVSGFGGLDHFAIYFTTVTYSKISNVWIKDCSDVNAGGIALFYSDNNIIRDCKLDNNRTHIATGDADKNYIAGNEVINSSGSAGIWLSVVSTGSLSNVIIGNFIDSNAKGIYIEVSKENEVTNNVISNSIDDGIAFDSADQNIFTGNRIVNNGAYGIDLGFAGSDNNIINGNYVVGNTSGGIRIAGTGNEIAHNITS